MKYLHKLLAMMLSMVLLLTIPMSVGNTQARISTGVTWSSVYTTVADEVTSDRLSEAGETVLLNDWTPAAQEASRTYQITFFTNMDTAEGTVSCSSNYPNYLTAALAAETVTADQTGKAVTLTLSLTEAALQLQENLTVTVRVNWSTQEDKTPELWADYKVSLTPELPEEEETITDVTVDTEQQPAAASWAAFSAEPLDIGTVMETVTAVTVLSELNPEPTETPTEPEETEAATEPEATEAPTEPEATETTPTEPEATEAPTEPEATETPPTEPEATETPPTEPEATEGPTEPEATEAPSEPETTEPLAPMVENYTATFAWTEWLGMVIVPPSGTDHIGLEYSGGKFPAGVKLRQTDGTEVIFGDETTITIPAKGTTQRVLLNMSHLSSTDKFEQMLMTVVAYDSAGNVLHTQTVQFSATATALSQMLGDAQLVIENNGQVSIACWMNEEGLDFFVEHLTKDGTGKLAYVEDDSYFGLYFDTAQETTTAEDGTSVTEEWTTISNASWNAPAGSYRVRLQRKFAGEVISSAEIPFFIHY